MPVWISSDSSLRSLEACWLAPNCPQLCFFCLLDCLHVGPVMNCFIYMDAVQDSGIRNLSQTVKYPFSNSANIIRCLPFGGTVNNILQFSALLVPPSRLSFTLSNYLVLFFSFLGRCGSLYVQTL